MGMMVGREVKKRGGGTCCSHTYLLGYVSNTRDAGVSIEYTNVCAQLMCEHSAAAHRQVQL
jgi:hypothetical protein